MRCPSLNELPAPPTGRSGWPWTEEYPQLPDTRPDGSAWPRISIVTPNYNYEAYIEETIRSVLLQGYPDLEFIVVDDSTDGSPDIIRKYQPWIAVWDHGRERGQTRAINLGFRRASGEIMAWLNSDDTYAPGAFEAVARALDPAGNVRIVYGSWRSTDQHGKAIYTPSEESLHRGRILRLKDWAEWWKDFPAGQPAVFWHKTVTDDVGLLDESLVYSMDHELFLRMAVRYPFHQIPQLLATFRLHPSSKTVLQRRGQFRESLACSRSYWGPRGSWIYLRNSISSWIWTRSIREAYAAAAESRMSRLQAAATLLKALLFFPPGFLMKPYPYLVAAYRICRGWDGST